MNITIQNVTMADLDACAAIEAEGFPAAEAASKESIKSRIEAYPAHFLTAKDERGDLLGYIMGAVIDREYIEDEMFSDVSLHDVTGAYQAVFSVCVKKEYQRQGIAGQLIEAFCALAKEQNRLGVTLTCKKEKLHYYAKFGFEDRGVAGSTHGDALWYNMVKAF